MHMTGRFGKPPQKPSVSVPTIPHLGLVPNGLLIGAPATRGKLNELGNFYNLYSGGAGCVFHVNWRMVMQIRQLNRNTYDVFGGTGFDNWTRVRRFHWGIKQIDGTFLPRPLLRDVSAAIEQNPRGSIHNVVIEDGDDNARNHQA